MKNYRFIFLKFLLLLLPIFVSLSCRQVWNKQSSSNSCSNTQSENNSKYSSVISKDVAVLIAKGKISYEYETSNYDEVVIDKGENWMVGFVFKSEYKNSMGGQPTVIVNKIDGSVTDYVFPK